MYDLFSSSHDGRTEIESGMKRGGPVSIGLLWAVGSKDTFSFVGSGYTHSGQQRKQASSVT